MAESFIQLPTDQAGKKQRHRERVIGADTIYESAVVTTGLPSYWVLADAVAPAANKVHMSIMNAGSNVVVRLQKLFLINVSTGAVSGAIVRFEFKKLTSHNVGTLLTPVKV